MKALAQVQGSTSLVTIFYSGETRSVRQIRICNSSTSTATAVVYMPFRSEATAIANQLVGPVAIGRTTIVEEFDPPLTIEADRSLSCIGNTAMNFTILGD